MRRTPGGAVVIRRGADFGVERVVLGPAAASGIGLAGNTVLAQMDGVLAVVREAAGDHPGFARDR